MSILQSIAYHANQSYMAGFLQQLIDQNGLKASIGFDGKKLELVIDEDDETALERFSREVALNLPHSLFMGTIETNPGDRAVSPERFEAKPADLPLCPVCLRELFDASSPSYLNKNLVCTHYGAKTPLSADAHPNIQMAADEILSGQEVKVGNRTYRRNYHPGDTLLITDPAQAAALLLLSKEETRALFSIEKPLLKTAVKDESLKALTGTPVITVRLFDDAPSAILSKKAKEKGFRYLFVRSEGELEVMVYKERTHIIHPGSLADRPLPLDADPVISHFLNITDEFGIRDISSLGANLNSSLEWQFIHRSAKVNKTVIRFKPFEPSGLAKEIAALSGARSRLVENFNKAFPGRFEALQQLAGKPDATLFDAVGAVMGIEGGFAGVSDASLGFAGNGGLKIDVRFKEGNFDYLSFLASIISFRVAGVEKGLLAYSLFESLGDLVTETLTQLKSRLQCSEVVLFGDMMTNTPLYSRILRNTGKAAPHISNRFPLDVQA